MNDNHESERFMMKITDSRIKLYRKSPQDSTNNNINYKERPLEQNPSDLSFKGLFLKPPKAIKQDEFVSLYEKYIGKNVHEHLDNIESNSVIRCIFIFLTKSNDDDIISNCFFKSFKQSSQNLICSRSLYCLSIYILTYLNFVYYNKLYDLYDI